MNDITNGTRTLSVIARNEVDGFYYAGFIKGGLKGQEEPQDVVFYKIKPQSLNNDHVIPIGGAVPWPTLQRGNYVLVAVRCRTSDVECYQPGRVIALPIDIRHEKRFYTVKLYNGGMTVKPRRYIVKIGEERYHKILQYLEYIRYRQPIRFNSEPNLRKWLIERPSVKNAIKTKKKPDNRRVVSAGNTRSKHYHHHYHHFFYHDNAQSGLRPWSSSTPTTSRTPLASSQPGGRIQNPPRPRSTPSPKMPSKRSSTPDRTRRNVSSQTTPSSTPYDTSPEKPSVKVVPRVASLHRDVDVLARWSDDGWYYFGKVIADGENGYVRVLDATGYEERIKREDILISEDNNNIHIKQYDKVVALHPRYVYSYAPATVLNVYNFGYRIQFYDDTERKLPSSEVYKISHKKYTDDVAYIKAQELKCSGYVIARDDVTGFYRPFIAESPDHHTQQIFLQLPNNSYKKQAAIHVFLRDGPKRKIDQSCKYVLGPLDPACSVFLPAQIVSSRPLRLMFCNGMQNDHAKLKQCFFISDDYYKNAVNYFFTNYSHT